MRSLVLSSLLLLALPAAAFAQQTSVRIENAWSRAAMAGHVGVVYLTIIDNGAPDRLTRVSSPVATKADLHESFSDHGVAKMRDVAALAIEPGKPVTLAPGGYHIMLTGLTQALKQGDSFPVTLDFEKAGQITATVTVQRSGDGKASNGAMSGMHDEAAPMQGGKAAR
jgi:periplasmic copper chaperone A